MDERGYSFVEVVVVASIISLTLSLSYARWDGFSRERRVVQAAEAIAGALVFAQQAAVADSVDACRYRVAVSSALSRATVYAVRRDETTGSCASPVVLTTAKVTDQLPRGVSVPDTTVEFTSEGRLAGTGQVVIQISAGDRIRDVRVEPATGRVQVATP